ncbi:unnamed protein product [Sphagnum jensenii]|uniref:Vps52 C-terminal domain-containing protein n=1 Tax=Sphagnum jensenii TaxID=128206 RepID=A0ABP1BGV0_9BRYO
MSMRIKPWRSFSSRLSSPPRDEVSLEGLEEELENLQGQQMIANILGQESQSHEYAHDVEEKLRQVEQESIKVAEVRLACFLEEMVVPPNMVDTILDGEVLSAHFQAYIQPLKRLQLDIVTKSDLIGLEDTGTHHSPGLFSQAWEPLKNCAAVFALGNWASLLKEVDEVVIIPCIAEASGHKYPYEVLSHNLHKLLMDTATSE